MRGLERFAADAKDYPEDLIVSDLDLANGVGTRTSVHVDVPRLRPSEAAEQPPATEDEPEISEEEGRTGFYLATGVIVLVSTWLGVYVHHAIQTGVFW